MAGTLIRQVALTDPQVAVMVVSPGFTPVTFPEASTVAISSFSEVHVTVLFVVFSGSTVAVIIIDSPIFTSASSGSNIIFSASMGRTFTRHVSVKSPQEAVITVSPTLTPVIFPTASTLAIVSLSVMKTTVLSVASSGKICVSSRNVSPILISIECSLTVKLSTGVGTTVIMQVAITLSHLAIISASPNAKANTLPFVSTVAIAGEFDDQYTVLSVVSSGRTSQPILKVSPTFKVALSGSRIISEATLGTTST